MPSNGYIFTNNNNIDLKVVFLKSEEHFEMKWNICDLAKNYALLMEAQRCISFNTIHHN